LEKRWASKHNDAIALSVGTLAPASDPEPLRTVDGNPAEETATACGVAMLIKQHTQKHSRFTFAYVGVGVCGPKRSRVQIALNFKEGFDTILPCI
jgi:hypothetical protein